MLPATRPASTRLPEPQQRSADDGLPVVLSACPPWNGSAPRRCAARSSPFRDTMKAHAAGINRLNVYPVPDGDTGTNMARTLDAVVAELDAAPARAGADLQRDQPRQPDGRPRQQRRDPQPDPARAWSAR